MNIAKLKMALPMFVQHVQGRSGENRILTVSDLHNAIRHIRMSEISEWSDHDLDVVEVHASRFDGTLPVESVLHSSIEIKDREHAAVSVSSICSPSPFAWT